MTTIVLNYMHADDTLRCVESLRAMDYPAQSIIVVDNGSGPNVVEQLQAGLNSAVTLLLSPENLGYAGGNNLGLQQAMDHRAEFMWVVNPDTVVEKDALATLVDTALHHPDAGVVGSRILFGGSDPTKIWYDGGTIDWDRGGATGHLHMGRRESDIGPGETHPTDYVNGASMLIRRPVLEEVGMLPEEYFLYYEETDFCTQVQRAGWSLLVEPKSRLWHFRRSAGDVPSPYYLYYICRNRLIFQRRFSPATGGHVPPDLQSFIEGWRGKVEKNAPSWLETFDHLVEMAIEDGIAGNTGQRIEIDQITGPSAEEILSRQLAQAREQVQDLTRRLEHSESRMAVAAHESERLARRLDAVHASRTWRAGRFVRRMLRSSAPARRLLRRNRLRQTPSMPAEPAKPAHDPLDLP